MLAALPLVPVTGCPTAARRVPAGGSHPAPPMRRCASHSCLSPAAPPLRGGSRRGVPTPHPPCSLRVPLAPATSRPAATRRIPAGGSHPTPPARCAHTYVCLVHPQPVAALDDRLHERGPPSAARSRATAISTACSSAPRGSAVQQRRPGTGPGRARRPAPAAPPSGPGASGLSGAVDDRGVAAQLDRRARRPAASAPAPAARRRGRGPARRAGPAPARTTGTPARPAARR